MDWIDAKKIPPPKDKEILLYVRDKYYNSESCYLASWEELKTISDGFFLGSSYADSYVQLCENRYEILYWIEITLPVKENGQ